MSGYFIGAGLVIAGLIAGIYGYVLNFIALLDIPIVASGWGVARIVGVVFPLLGAVLGYF